MSKTPRVSAALPAAGTRTLGLYRSHLLKTSVDLCRPERWRRLMIAMAFFIGLCTWNSSANAEIACPAGQVHTYYTSSVNDSTFGALCTANVGDNAGPGNILHKYFDSGSAATGAVSAACDGSRYGNKAIWTSVQDSFNGTELLMAVNVNGQDLPGTDGEIYIQCKGGYYVAAPPPTNNAHPAPEPGSTCNACKSGATAVGHPIDPASGNEFEAKSDYVAENGGLRLTRSYNSNASTTGVLGAKWQHNFSAHIDNAYSSFRTLDYIFGTTSSVYQTPSDACTQGWPNISLVTSELDASTTGATATFDAATSSCVLSTGQSVPVYSTASTSSTVLQATSSHVAIAATRDDGAVYTFDCDNGLCTPESDVPLNLILSSTG